MKKLWKAIRPGCFASGGEYNMPSRLHVLLRGSGLCEEREDGSVRIAPYPEKDVAVIARSVAEILKVNIWIKMEGLTEDSPGSTFLFTTQRPRLGRKGESWVCEFYHRKAV